jgi:hypothetical protein
VSGITDVTALETPPADEGSLTIGADRFRPDMYGLPWHAEAHVGRVKNVHNNNCQR